MFLADRAPGRVTRVPCAYMSSRLGEPSAVPAQNGRQINEIHSQFLSLVKL